MSEEPTVAIKINSPGGPVEEFERALRTYRTEPDAARRARLSRWLDMHRPDLRSRAERAIDRLFFPPAVRIDM